VVLLQRHCVHGHAVKYLAKVGRFVEMHQVALAAPHKCAQRTQQELLSWHRRNGMGCDGKWGFDAVFVLRWPYCEVKTLMKSPVCVARSGDHGYNDVRGCCIVQAFNRRVLGDT
jgi:hypothetical protein